MDYLKPYVDEFITDTYGTAVGVINPKAPFKVVIEAHSSQKKYFHREIRHRSLILVILKYRNFIYLRGLEVASAVRMAASGNRSNKAKNQEDTGITNVLIGCRA